MSDDLSRVRVLFTYRSFTNQPDISHIGLGISSVNNYRVLRQNGIDALIQGITKESELRAPLDRDPEITHLISAAPWVSTAQWAFLADNFPEVAFAVNCHSNIGFLQTDPGAIQLMRQQMDLETWKHNLHVSGNSEEFCDAINAMYGVPCTFLPNLYYMDDSSNAALSKPGWSGGLLKVGLFGAPRCQKNVASGAAAVLIAARDLNVPVEIWMNTGRDDNNESERILNSVKALVGGLPTVSLKFFPWAEWPAFKRFIGTMDVCMQPSYTETFNIVTADAASQGVPSVVSDAITWAPDEWKARVDSPQNIARTLIAVLHDPASGRRGIQALQERNAVALEAWKRFLLNNQFGISARRWTAIGHPMSGMRNLSAPRSRRTAAEPKPAVRR